MDPERWKRVDRLVQAVLERPPGERDAFLRLACGDDHELERETRSLLTAQQQAGNFPDSPSMELSARALAREQISYGQDQADDLIGRAVSHYRVVAKLGCGGMGGSTRRKTRGFIGLSRSSSCQPSLPQTLTR